jgi:hypothetical protein
MTKVVHEVVALAALGVVGYFAGALLSPGGEAQAKNRYALEPPNVEARRAFRYARTEPEACLEELDRRGFPYELEKPTKQVDTPMRIAGPVRGVRFALTKRAEPNPDPTSPAAILDCSLALAIDDFAKVLAAHDVVRVEYMSMYRTRGLGFIKPGRRHPSGRAIDVATLTRKDGKTFNVAYDFHGWPGAKTCGEGAAKPRKDTEGARLFREVVCELSDMGSFNLLLTPHYDWGHRDHLHMEVRSDIRWFLIQ